MTRALLLALAALAAARPGGDAPRFPLRVAADHRHLAGVDGRPFLVAGDAAWSLIAQLSPADAARYLDDRARRGFTAVIVNLIEHKFATGAPANHDGVQPFAAPGDFARPSPPYFAAAHAVIEAARQRGISVWLCPAYLGWDGGDEGFYQEMAAAGPAALRQYGRFVGSTFKDLANIVWMPGGDYALTPDKRWVVEELVAGLKEGGAMQIMTAHGGQTTATQTYGDRPWLDVETVYSYEPDLIPQLLAAYHETPARPFVMIESTYEGEHDVTAPQVRRQAWAAMLAGAAGQFFGNNPIWHFDGPTLFPFTGTWQENLDRQGSRDMTRLARFFTETTRTSLEPIEGAAAPRLVAAGQPRVSAARTADGVVVLYVPSDGTTGERELTLADGMAGPNARWINPSRDEAARAVTILARGDAGTVRVGVPGDNGTIANDWVLVWEPFSVRPAAARSPRASSRRLRV